MTIDEIVEELELLLSPDEYGMTKRSTQLVENLCTEIHKLERKSWAGEDLYNTVSKGNNVYILRDALDKYKNEIED